MNNGSPFAINLRASVTRTDACRAPGDLRIPGSFRDQLLSQPPPIPARSTFLWTPPADQCTVTTATPTITNSGSISVDYNQAISLHVSGYGYITIPIVLGNVPPRSPVGPLKPPQYPPLPTYSSTAEVPWSICSAGSILWPIPSPSSWSTTGLIYQELGQNQASPPL